MQPAPELSRVQPLQVGGGRNRIGHVHSANETHDERSDMNFDACIRLNTRVVPPPVRSGPKPEAGSQPRCAVTRAEVLNNLVRRGSDTSVMLNSREWSKGQALFQSR